MTRILSLVILLALKTLAQEEQVETHCEVSESVSFVKLDRQLAGAISDYHITLINKTLFECSVYCSDNKGSDMQVSPCAGFAYSSQKQVCVLTDNKPSSLISDHDKTDNLIIPPIRGAGDFRADNDDTGLYQKVCLRASVEDYLPANVPFSFQLISDRVLMGSTEEVVVAKSLSQCLSICLEAGDIFDIACRSVMYYYETGQCLLNSMDHRSNFAHLSNDTENMHVDYFENLIVGHECGPGTVPQYAYLSNKDMIEEHNFVIDKVSKFTCQHYCTSNKGANGQLSMCKSFAYHEAKQICYLMNEQATPRGNGRAKEVTGVEIYEKICLSAFQTCVKTPAFERVPMHVLIGFAQIVMENVRNEELCLSECLSSFPNLGFDCMSVMYYYGTNECILNFDSRLSQKAKPFFTNNTEGYKVDYFDNLCGLRLRDAGQALNSCPERLASTFIQFNATELPKYFVESYSAVDLEDCLSKCDTVKNFTCNSADYRISDSMCSLSHVDSRTTSLMIVPDSLHFERHCIEGTTVCQARPVSFVTENGIRLVGSETLSVEGISLDECFSLCLLDPTQACQSINYDRRKITCQLNNNTRSYWDSVEDSDADYYENKCFNHNSFRQAIVRQSLVGDVLAAQTGIDIQTNCIYSSMKVIMTAQQPFTGYMFAKNKFWSCGVQVQNSANAQLVLSFPTFSGAQNDCGVIALSPSKYSAIVVVTMNNLGIPGLVADGDRFFNITCDYTSSFQNRVTAIAPSLAVSNPVNEGNLFPDGVINIPSPVQLQMRKFANDQQSTVHMVEVGEQVTLDIIYAEGFNRSLLDFFARQCNASRHYGPPPDPEPLILIKDGCPTQSVVNKIIRSPVERTATGLSLSFTAFRFDGSNSVKITCLVDLCEGHCNPTSCNINGQTVPSYGRKKRFDQKGKIKQSDTGSFIFTVVDRMPVENREIPISNKLERLKKLQNNVGDFSDQHFVDGSNRKQLCLKKSTFYGVFIFLLLLCVCQVVVIVIYLIRRFLKTEFKKL